MKTSTTENRKDLKCIWMLAGVVNYKLCDRNFNCETCEFDRIMRGMLPYDKRNESSVNKYSNIKETENESVAQKLVNQYLFTLLSNCKIHLDRCYHPSHFWFKSESDDTVQVGIDELLIKILQPVDRIILPEMGEVYRSGQLIAWIIRKGKTFPLHSPVEGKVIEINPPFLLNSIKQIINENCYLFKMQRKNIQEDVKQMCGNLQSLKNYLEKVELVKIQLAESFRSNLPLNLGTTLADGGEVEKDLEKIIGQKDFQKLVTKLLKKE